MNISFKRRNVTVFTLENEATLYLNRSLYIFDYKYICSFYKISKLHIIQLAIDLFKRLKESSKSIY